MAKESDIFEKPPAKALTAKQLDELLARVRMGELVLHKGSNPEKLYFGKPTSKKGLMRVGVQLERAALNTHRVAIDELAK